MPLDGFSHLFPPFVDVLDGAELGVVDEPPAPVDGLDPPPFVVLRAAGTGLDDAAAFRVAVAAASAGTTFYLPDASYEFRTADADNVCVAIGADNISFVGKGRSQIDAGNPVGDGNATAILCKGAAGVSNATIFQWYADKGSNTTNNTSSVYGGGLSRIGVGGQSNANYIVEIQAGVTGLVFDDAWLGNAKVAAIVGGTGCTHGSTNHTWHSTFDITFNHCVIRSYTTSHGVSFQGNPNIAGGENCYGWSFIGTTVITTDGNALDVVDADDIYVIGGELDTSGSGAPIYYHAATAPKSAGARAIQVLGAYGNLTAAVAEGGTGTASRASRTNLILSMSTEDVTGVPTQGAGAHLFWIDDQGRHNLRRDIRASVALYDDFMLGNVTTGTIGDLGWFLTNGTVTYIDSVTGHHGIRRLDTSSTISTLASVYLIGSSTVGTVLPADNFILEYVFRLTQVDTDTMFRVGLGLQFLSDPPTNNGIYVEKLYADTGLWGVCRSGGSQTRTSLLTTVAAGTWYRLTIRRINDTDIGFSLGDVSDWADTVRIGTHVPTVAMNPFLHMRNQVASSKTVDIDAFQLLVNGLSR